MAPQMFRRALFLFPLNSILLFLINTHPATAVALTTSLAPFFYEKRLTFYFKHPGISEVAYVFIILASFAGFIVFGVPGIFGLRWCCNRLRWQREEGGMELQERRRDNHENERAVGDGGSGNSGGVMMVGNLQWDLDSRSPTSRV